MTQACGRCKHLVVEVVTNDREMVFANQIIVQPRYDLATEMFHSVDVGLVSKVTEKENAIALLEWDRGQVEVFGIRYPFAEAWVRRHIGNQQRFFF